jgi:hypothetical protein
VGVWVGEGITRGPPQRPCDRYLAETTNREDPGGRPPPPPHSPVTPSSPFTHCLLSPVVPLYCCPIADDEFDYDLDAPAAPRGLVQSAKQREIERKQLERKRVRVQPSRQPKPPTPRFLITCSIRVLLPICCARMHGTVKGGPVVSMERLCLARSHAPPPPNPFVCPAA